MFKKIGLASVILLANSNVSFAQTVPAPSQTAAATAAGIETPTAPASRGAGTTASAPAGNKPAIASPYLGIGISMLNVRGFTGLMPKIYAGYDTLLGRKNMWFWGIEAFAGLGSWRLSPNSRFRVTEVFGASVLPGFKYNEWTVIFARLGAESAHFSKLNSTKIGGLVGLGLQTYEFEHWYLRLEYDYNFINNVNQYNLDFLYKFC